jgi:hypothetical protein
MRRFYTDDAGYALAKQVDDDLFSLGKRFGNDAGTGTDWVHSNSYYVNATSGIATYAVDTMSLLGMTSQTWLSVSSSN